MLNAVLIAVDALASVLLVLLILLHSGRGGLSDFFGGGMGGGVGSSVAERNLDRITILVGLVFGVATALLVVRLR